MDPQQRIPMGRSLVTADRKHAAQSCREFSETKPYNLTRRSQSVCTRIFKKKKKKKKKATSFSD